MVMVEDLETRTADIWSDTSSIVFTGLLLIKMIILFRRVEFQRGMRWVGVDGRQILE